MLEISLTAAVWTSRDEFVAEGLRLSARHQDLIDTLAVKLLLAKRGQHALDVLKDTYLDISQGHDRMKHSRADGVACTFTTSTLLYPYSEDRVVLPFEMMLMHGFPRSAIAPRSIGQRALKDMVGNGMSLPCLATMIWAFWVMRNRQFEAPQQTPLQIRCPSRVFSMKQKQTPTPANLEKESLSSHSERGSVLSLTSRRTSINVFHPSGPGALVGRLCLGMTQ